MPVPETVTPPPGVGTDGKPVPDSPDYQMPVGHTIHSSVAVKRGDQIIQVDDTRGLKAGMRFLVGKGATQEIVLVESLGSIVTAAPLVNGHAINTPIVRLRNDVETDTTVPVSADEEMNKRLGLWLRLVKTLH